MHHPKIKINKIVDTLREIIPTVMETFRGRLNECINNGGRYLGLLLKNRYYKLLM